jgi:hypothetical protein
MILRRYHQEKHKKLKTKHLQELALHFFKTATLCIGKITPATMPS